MLIHNYKIKYILIIFLIILFYNIINYLSEKILDDQIKEHIYKRVGIIAYPNDNNIGNQLLKYAMHIILKKLGFNSTLISLKPSRNFVPNIQFLQKYVKIKEINNYYTDIKETDFDFLIVNSDQVWAHNFRYLFAIGFLSFAKNWNIKKIIYGVSIGHDHWIIQKEKLKSLKELIKHFSGISVREEDSIDIINKSLGIKPQFVLDPTLLLDKTDYLEIIENYQSDIDRNQNYLCSYILDKSLSITNYIRNIADELKYNIIDIDFKNGNFIERFIFSINICKSIITDSFHGTLFSIIFNKPFISFINTNRGNARFLSLNRTFQLGGRFIYQKIFEKKEISLLLESPKINMTYFKILRTKSLNFLKNNLGIMDHLDIF